MSSRDAAHDPSRARVAPSLAAEAIRTAPWGLCALLLAAFMATPYLPMVDLPQHAAQIAAWLRLDDSAFPYSKVFELNLRTPYLTAYVAARWLASAIGVLPALKVVVWASAALHLVAFSRLVRRLGHPAWLGLLGLPLGLGYPFYFGVVSFAAGVPFVLFSVIAALDHAERATWRSAATLAAWLCATLISHGFAAGIACLFVAPLLLRGAGKLAVRVAPLAAPVALWGAWIYPAGSVRTIGGTVWAPRLLELLGAPSLWFAASAADHVAVALGYGALSLVALALGGPSRRLERWVPLSVALAGFCLFPLMLSGFGPLHPRFAAFLVPALLLAFEPRREPRSRAVALSVIAFCGLWFGVLVVRLDEFTRETRAVREFVERMPPGLSMRPIVFERNSTSFPGLPVLLHVSAYYMVEKGGLQGYSFAMYPTSVIRYAPAFVPGMRGGAEWHPEWFSPELEVGAYDCFLVHAGADPIAIFGARGHDLSLDFHDDGWWAYRSTSPQASLERTEAPW
ncbi:MAG TPA: hypothetical protein VHC69_21425 [Polyangiaceae bacterium]|nr:hypothetical protein [Polyangiaceae bacterium]